jgi:ABC-type glutathione transport system ATPase component
MLLTVRDARFRHPGAKRWTVDGVSLDVEAGGTFALVGESGSGKSTLIRLVMGLLPLAEGSIFFDDARIDRMGEAERRPLRAQMGMVFQDPAASLNPRRTVLQALAEPFEVHRPEMRRPEIAEEALHLLETVGLGGDHLHRFPHELSGGQRQRVSIARALALRPRLVLLDEPTSALDVSVQAQILNLLLELQRSLGLAYLFVSHDLAVVAYMADRIGVMQGGRLVECAATDALLAMPSTEYTRALLDAYTGP